MTEQAAAQPNYDADDWFAMGAEAFGAGQPLDLCPSYDEDAEAAQNWEAGWRKAMNEALTEGGY